MDILSHGLYGGAAFGRKNRRDFWIAFLFGILPDLLAFGPFFISAFLGFVPLPIGNIEVIGSRPVPGYVHSTYNATHSLVIYVLFFGLLWLLGKKSFAKLTLGWPLHILVDMPLHTREFFSTPFLWPIANVQIDGIPWSTPYIFFPNVILLILIYGYWCYKNKHS